jgi:hypothetical protein
VKGRCEGMVSSRCMGNKKGHEARPQTAGTASGHTCHAQEGRPATRPQTAPWPVYPHAPLNPVISSCCIASTASAANASGSPVLLAAYSVRCMIACNTGSTRTSRSIMSE